MMNRCSIAHVSATNASGGKYIMVHRFGGESFGWVGLCKTSFCSTFRTLPSDLIKRLSIGIGGILAQTSYSSVEAYTAVRRSLKIDVHNRTVRDGTVVVTKSVSLVSYNQAIVIEEPTWFLALYARRCIGDIHGWCSGATKKEARVR